MEPESSLTHPQFPATCPYPEQDQYSPCLHIPLAEDPSHYCPRTYSWVFQVFSFPQVSTPKPITQFYSPPYVLHASSHLILLDLITGTIKGNKYRSLRSSLCSFLHSPIILFVIGSNILLSILFSNTLRLHSSLTVSDQVSHWYSSSRLWLGGGVLGWAQVRLGEVFNGKTVCKHPGPAFNSPLSPQIHMFH